MHIRALQLMKVRSKSAPRPVADLSIKVARQGYAVET